MENMDKCRLNILIWGFGPVHTHWGAAIVIFVAILLAYLKHGESAGYVGGIGILAVGLSIFGIQAGSKGLKERERKYITCRVGIACNILILIFLIVIFVGGIR